MGVSSLVPQTNSPSQSGGQTATSGSSNTGQTSDDYNPVGQRYFGALVLLAVIIPLPFFGALVTLIVYLSPSSMPEVPFLQWLGTNILVIILGLIITSGLWLLLAIPCRIFVTAKGGRPTDFTKLLAVAGVLKKQFEITTNAQSSKHTGGIQYDTTIAEIEDNFKMFYRGLNCNGLPWVSYSGYVSMWDLINKIDEAMVGILPCGKVIESANYDILRLTNSEVPDNQNLVKSLNEAINTLRLGSKGPTGSSTATNGQYSQQTEQTARSNIRQAKSALHNFTNELWDGLVRARTQLMRTAFLTAFFSYIFVIIAILAQVPNTNILDAMVFYFLGAIVGLFGRLFDERNADKVIDDYGLSTIRIIVTPLISGLAVLLGILFVTTSSTIDTLYQITLQNLVFATILGFAPNILISTLQNKSEEIKGQLKGASPLDGKSGKGVSSKVNDNPVKIIQQ